MGHTALGQNHIHYSKTDWHNFKNTYKYIVPSWWNLLQVISTRKDINETKLNTKKPLIICKRSATDFCFQVLFAPIGSTTFLNLAVRSYAILILMSRPAASNRNVNLNFIWVSSTNGESFGRTLQRSNDPDSESKMTKRLLELFRCWDKLWL